MQGATRKCYTVLHKAAVQKLFACAPVEVSEYKNRMGKRQMKTFSKRLSKSEYAKYVVKILSTPQGRKTQVIEKNTGITMLFLGANVKSDAIASFKYQKKKGLRGFFTTTTRQKPKK